MIKVSYNRCKDIHKFGNKYLPSAYKTQVDFRSHFSGKKVCLIVFCKHSRNLLVMGEKQNASCGTKMSLTLVA